MQELLRQFNGDFNTKEALKAFIIDVINQEAIEKMYKREDVSHIADATELIEKAFDKLETTYGIQTKQTLPINQAR